MSLLALAMGAAPAAAANRAARAQALYEKAQAHIARNTFDDRRLAVAELEEATLLKPDDPGLQLALARLYERVGFLGRARQRFENVARLQPESAIAQMGVGDAWRRDWLKYQDDRSYARALDRFEQAVMLDPRLCDAWVRIAPMLAEREQWRAAYNAALRAREADPERLDAALAEAYTSYHMGRTGHADSLFAAVIPKLPRPVRERFEDIAPIASDRDTFVLHRLLPADQGPFIERFWREQDPDLASPVNEARLEYRARVAHAFFLYYNQRRNEWDMRGEVYCRYGPPALIRYNPVGANLMVYFGTVGQTPINLLVWDYPEYGMQVQMEDRVLNDFYYLPMLMERDPEPRPSPDAVTGRDDLIAVRGGRGVFPTLPPGVERRPVDALLARFDADAGGRLLAQIQTPGGPDDSLTGEWVCLDGNGNEVTRGTATLVPSACEPLEMQVAEFAGLVRPGPYTVGISVGDRDGRRGVYRGRIDIPLPGQALTMSDVVVTCGIAPATASVPTVRLEPNPAALVVGSDPLTAYFEISHLALDAQGRTRFEYVYTVRSAAKDARIWIQRVLNPRSKTPPIEVTRTEEGGTTLRRQFVSIPLNEVPTGLYRLEITVRDLVAGTEASRSALFTRLADQPTPRN